MVRDDGSVNKSCVSCIRVWGAVALASKWEAAAAAVARFMKV